MLTLQSHAYSNAHACKLVPMVCGVYWLLALLLMPSVVYNLKTGPSQSRHAERNRCQQNVTPCPAGDFFDLATSPNEVLLFFLHHANIDRNNMIWQVSLA